MSLDKPASLSLIARANGKPTGDELVMARDEEEARIKRAEWLASGLGYKLPLNTPARPGDSPKPPGEPH